MAKGFTLIELMIVVAIVAILATLAYYNYGQYAFRARRADGREILMRIAAAEERFYTNFNSYTGDLTDPPTGAAPGLGLLGGGASEKGYYLVNVTLQGGGTNYQLNAVPQNVQTTDACLTLTITDTGFKSQTGSATTNGNCW